MDNILTLYTGPHCHLCDQAKAVIYPVIEEAGWQLEEVNIAEDESLKDKYAVRIPVIVLPDGQEKGWPFSSGQVKRLIRGR
ncbi:MAG: glutaredoxin family protein [Porticoccus sp.]|nr:glutaredoxin family protein [Porticoccus sp.]MBQ0807122.1 glutaredoxin family protein [Porticoccus sp.]